MFAGIDTRIIRIRTSGLSRNIRGQGDKSSIFFYVLCGEEIIKIIEKACNYLLSPLSTLYRVVRDVWKLENSLMNFIQLCQASLVSLEGTYLVSFRFRVRLPPGLNFILKR
jgi:hypothetical protein